MSDTRPWRHLYKTARWQRLRLAILARDLFACQMPGCNAILTGGRENRGGVMRSGVVDHIRPHKGDEVLFFDPANLQAICKECHDSRKQLIERHGFDPTVGEDGWPIDPDHPALEG